MVSEGSSSLETSIRILVLLDIQLPIMDGYTVAGRLRRIESLAAVPIIAVTSHAMVGDREKAIAAGCDGYIEKPIDPVTFIAQIESVATSPAADEGKR